MEGHLVHHFVFVDKSLLVLLIDRIVRMAFPAIKGLDALFVHRPIAVGKYLQMGLFRHSASARARMPSTRMTCWPLYW